MQATIFMMQPNQQTTGITYDKTLKTPGVALHEVDGVVFAVQICHNHLPLSQLALQRLELVAIKTPESELQAWTDKMVDSVKCCKANMENNDQQSKGYQLAKRHMIQEDEQILRYLTGSQVQDSGSNPSNQKRFFSTYNNHYSQHGPAVQAPGDTPVLCHAQHSTLMPHETLQALHQLKDLTTDGYQKALLASIKAIQQCQLIALEGQIQTLSNTLAPNQLKCLVNNGSQNMRNTNERFQVLFDGYQTMIDDDKILLSKLSEELRKLG